METRATPTNMENSTTCSISPCTIELNGLPGSRPIIASGSSATPGIALIAVV